METWVKLPPKGGTPSGTYPPEVSLTGGHSNNATCCHGNHHHHHHYGALVQTSTTHPTTLQPRRTPITSDRLSSRSSHVCRVIHCLLITCFLVNILVLLGLQILPYVTSDVTSSDVIRDVNLRPQEEPLARRQRGASAILRQLREAPMEEELLTSDAVDVTEEEQRQGLSPFTNWTSGVQTDWEANRNRFTASGIAFPVNQPRLCDAQTFLVVMVTSAVQNADRRQTIRDTWGSVAKLDASKVTLIFLLGESQNINVTQARLLHTESETHKDIIQANIVDSYSNLAFKSIAMLKWMDTYCKSAKYLLKSDDDMYINLDNLKRELVHSVHKRFIMGEIIAGAQPMQDKNSKWYTPKAVFSDRMYPKYVSGSAYVISGDFIHDLYRATQETEVFWLEDVYITGLCAKKARATHVYNGKFGYKRRRLSPCLFKMIVTGHRLTTGEMHRVWKALQNPQLQCSHTNIRSTVA